MEELTWEVISGWVIDDLGISLPLCKVCSVDLREIRQRYFSQGLGLVGIVGDSNSPLPSVLLLQATVEKYAVPLTSSLIARTPACHCRW